MSIAYIVVSILAAAGTAHRSESETVANTARPFMLAPQRVPTYGRPPDTSF